MVYYRLRQLDQDGAEKVFDVVAAPACNDHGVLVYPNPNCGDRLFIQLTGVEEAATVEVHDPTGKRMLTRSIAVAHGFAQAEVELNGALSVSVYVVRVTAGAKVYTERLVVAE